MNKVSILIPVYNRERYIADCIDSAIHQTYNEIEIIIVDNASTDKTWEICKLYEKKDIRVKIYRNEENIGVINNFQRCIDLASGEFSKFLFSDDLISEYFIEKTLPYLLNDNVGFVFTGIKLGQGIEDAQKTFRFSHGSRIIDAKHALEMVAWTGLNLGTPGSAIYRTWDLRQNLVKEIPSPTLADFPSHGAGNDLLISLLTANKYKNIVYIDEDLSFFREHKDSISVDFDKRTFNLYSCYHQARIFFGEQYLSKESIRKMYIYVWFDIMKRRRSLLLPNSILKQFTFNDININYKDIYRAIIVLNALVSRTIKLKLFNVEMI